VRKEIAQWKKLFHSCSLKGFENLALMVPAKQRNARRMILQPDGGKRNCKNLHIRV